MLLLFWKTTAAPTLVSAAPSADVLDGSWTNEVGSQVNLYASIDETVASDADFIQSSLSPATVDEVRVRLAPLSAPSSDSDHAIHLRVGKSEPGGDRLDLTVTLYTADGTTPVKSQTLVDIGTVADVVITLTTGEAATIPDADYGLGLVLALGAVKV